MGPMIARPGALIEYRPVKPGDAAAIARIDTGYHPDNRWDTWIDQADRMRLHEVTVGTQRRRPRPGRDCPACPADAEAHGEWGAPTTGCLLNRASLVIARRRLR